MAKKKTKPPAKKKEYAGEYGKATFTAFVKKRNPDIDPTVVQDVVNEEWEGLKEFYIGEALSEVGNKLKANLVLEDLIALGSIDKLKNSGQSPPDSATITTIHEGEEGWEFITLVKSSPKLDYVETLPFGQKFSVRVNKWKGDDPLYEIYTDSIVLGEKVPRDELYEILKENLYGSETPLNEIDDYQYIVVEATIQGVKNGSRGPFVKKVNSNIVDGIETKGQWGALGPCFALRCSIHPDLDYRLLAEVNSALLGEVWLDIFSPKGWEGVRHAEDKIQAISGKLVEQTGLIVAKGKGTSTQNLWGDDNKNHDVCVKTLCVLPQPFDPAAVKVTTKKALPKPSQPATKKQPVKKTTLPAWEGDLIETMTLFEWEGDWEYVCTNNLLADLADGGPQTEEEFNEFLKRNKP